MKCPHCGGEIEEPVDDLKKEREEERAQSKADEKRRVMALWNRLAKDQGLRRITMMTEARFRGWVLRLREHQHFWSELCDAVAQRGAWARKKKFPTFDQAVSPSFLAKLLEGNYDGDPVEERHELIERILERGKVGKTTATPAGLEGGAGCETWNEISTERLRKMAAVQIADESF